MVPRRTHPLVEVLFAFAWLGVTSFGGPAAHLAYFRREFVAKRAWLTEAGYAQIVALAQFLPGPSSSQVGMAIGWRYAGLPGLLVAWLAFTLPSAAFMAALALGLSGPLATSGGPPGWVVGRLAAAVAVVAQAVFAMARALAATPGRAAIALGAALGTACLPSAWTQVAVVGVGAVAGLAFLRPSSAIPVLADVPAACPHTARLSVAALGAFLALMLALPAWAVWGHSWWGQLTDLCYRTGALVFGGGHVVLPLLEAGTVGQGWLGEQEFLSGYGAAQAVPGPLFTFAAYLGAAASGPGGAGGLPGALLATVAIFLPSALLLVGVLPWWERIAANGRVQRALAGTNAAVVGLLAAALYRPVLTEGITSLPPAALALASLAALLAKAPAWAVVAGAAAVGAALW